MAHSIIRLLFIVCLLTASGCSLFRDEAKIAEQQQELETRRARHAALTGAINDGTLSEGLTAQAIRDLYGEPTDIFRSGSSLSPMEIWTYEKVLEKDEEDWSPVRLYLERGKLITWKY